jgi:hypothetical protein
MLKGKQNVAIEGFNDEYINRIGILNVKELYGALDVYLDGELNVYINGLYQREIMLVGTTFYVNLVGSIGEIPGAEVILASNGIILASNGTILASNGV